MNKNQGIILNFDFLSFIGTRFNAGVSIENDEVLDYIDQYVGTQVTDCCININASLSYTQSEILETCFDKYIRMKQVYQDNPTGIDYIADISRQHLEYAYEVYINKDIDIHKLMIERLWKNGIRPWISIRMNDLHGSKDPLDARASRFSSYAADNKLLRIDHRPHSGYFDKCLNYKKPEIFNRMLAYMQEQLEQNDAGGIELDFLREPFCFKPGDESGGREVINSLIRKLKETAVRLSTKRNRNIKIMVRVPSNPLHAYDMGFDIYTWAKEKLVDILVITPRFTSCDSTMPVDSWVRIFEDYDIEIVAGLEIFSASYPGSMDNYTGNTVDMAVGYAVSYHCAGSNGIYLYNYFDDPALKNVKPVNTIEFRDEDLIIESSGVYGGLYDTTPRAGCCYRDFLSTIGSLDTCINLPRRHIMTFNDIGPIWSEIHSELPIRLTNGESRFVNVITGEIPKKAKAYLLIGINENDNTEDLKIWCNCTPCSYSGTTKIYPKMTKSTVLVYAIDGNSYQKYNQVIEFMAESVEINIDYLEIRIF